MQSNCLQLYYNYKWYLYFFFRVKRPFVIGQLLKVKTAHGFVTLQVLPSPTTGKFSFAPIGDYRDSTLMACDSDKGKENNFEDINASSFAFKPITESASFPYFAATNKVIDYALHLLPCLCMYHVFVRSLY